MTWPGIVESLAQIPTEGLQTLQSPYTSQFLSGREASNPNTLVVIATSTVNSSQGWTTEVDGYVGKTSAGPGKGNVKNSSLPFWL